jgi:hypothetical protein
MVIGDPDIPTYGLCLCFIFFDIHDIIIASQMQVAIASDKSHHIVSHMVQISYKPINGKYLHEC